MPLRAANLPLALAARLLLLAFFCLAAAPAGADEARYRQFVNGFRATALKAGISPETYEAAFKGLTPDPEVIEKDRHQPEFTLDASQYVALTVTDTRVRIGREKLAKLDATLDAIEKEYGVDRHVLLAIWGMETNFGAFMGGHNVIRALSTLAYTGGRRDFGRRQLLAALKMIERGHATPEGLVGSWAGAVGYTQLIPTNFLKYAVDFDGDGRKDLWNSPADALASAANYLDKAGWDRGHAWGYEVSLPKGVGRGYEGRRRSRSLARWEKLGVKRVKGQDYPRPGDRAYLYLPMGTKGPAFLLLDNFRTIMRYNNAHTYALSVSHLSDLIRGGGRFVTPWPDGVRALDEPERFEMQNLLIALGYDIGKVDGVLGSKTRAALRAYLKKKGEKNPDGFPTPKVLEMLRADAPAVSAKEPPAKKEPQEPQVKP